MAKISKFVIIFWLVTFVWTEFYQRFADHFLFISEISPVCAYITEQKVIGEFHVIFCSIMFAKTGLISVYSQTIVDKSLV